MKPSPALKNEHDAGKECSSATPSRPLLMMSVIVAASDTVKVVATAQAVCSPVTIVVVVAADSVFVILTCCYFAFASRSHLFRIATRH